MMVTLPWPPKACSPNARSRTYHKHAAAKKAYRSVCGWTAKAAGLRLINATALNVSITFCPPDRLARDDDNMIAAFKAGRDGVADVLGVDDARWTVTYRRGAPVKGGAVVLTVTGADYAALGVVA